MQIETSRGTARVHLDHASGDPAGLLLLGHGAGGGVEAADLSAARDAALEVGMTAARVEQPYRVAGRRAPAPATHLDEAWNTVAVALRSELAMLDAPLVAGGRSSGARVACRTAEAVGATAVLALAFPLHPPGRPERSRGGELADVGVPVLVVNGDRDPFGVPEPSGSVRVRVAPGERHALDRRPGAIREWVEEWLESVLSGGRMPDE